MNPSSTTTTRTPATPLHRFTFTAILATSNLIASLHAQEPPSFVAATALASGEVSLALAAARGTFYRLEFSTDLRAWTPATTGLSTGTNTHVDAASLLPSPRFYRAIALAGSNWITGDHLPTARGDAILHPVNHASFTVHWNGINLYNDPVGATSLYRDLPKADILLVSHIHNDHFSDSTLSAVRATPAVIIAPAAVYASLSATLKAITIPLANGASTNVGDVRIDAIPAYNANHPKGAGNGYVVTLADRKLFMSGDTGDIAEMRALRGIDAAFVCMNIPFTMTVEQAASTIREFQPRIVYPYHYKNSTGTFADLNLLKRLVGSELGIDVRARKWY